MASWWNRALNTILRHCWFEMRSFASKSLNAHFLEFWSVLTLLRLWDHNPVWPGCRPGSRIEFQVFLTANWIAPFDIKVKPKFHQDNTAKAVLVWCVDICLKSVFQKLIIFALAMQIHYINVNSYECMQYQKCLGIRDFRIPVLLLTFIFLKVSLSICRVLSRHLNTNYKLLRNICAAQAIHPLGYHSGPSFNMHYPASTCSLYRNLLPFCLYTLFNYLLLNLVP